MIVGVGWSVDGLYKTEAYVSNFLAADASVTINSRSYIIPGGTYTIMAYADNVNRFIESNETNNQLSKTIMVRTSRAPAHR